MDHPIPSASGMSPASRAMLVVSLLATLFLLVVHARVYEFLTDDAYISFRYARNLAEGHGLVFNPGYERVEGYTNFLWVLILAGLLTLGVPPETAAPMLSILLTVALWAVVVAFAWRNRPSSRIYLILVPPVLLAVTRSVAVWSTSGLETRLFEFLVVAGVLRLVGEDGALGRGARPVLPLGGLLLALATLTRPDGLLISASVLGALVFLRRHAIRERLSWTLYTVAVFAVLVGGHFLFRYAYYGAWLPNTFYAKFGGEIWWEMGLRYLGSFFLEYGVYLWIPFLIAAVVRHRRRGTHAVPVLFAAAVLPHAAYVLGLGGDHFEYRPLDLYFPFAYLLILDGAAHLVRGARSALAVGCGLLLVVAFVVELPLRSHRQFPRSYFPGFPGLAVGSPLERGFLAPEETLIYRVPGLRAIGRGHRDLLRATTRHFVGNRQEEHKLFLGRVLAEADALASLIESGKLPPDTYLATDCVGAIPYRTDLRILDRLGLTDARVARGRLRNPKMMGHGKFATADYARERGVDLWAVDNVHFVWNGNDPSFIRSLVFHHRSGEEQFFADLGDGRFLLAGLPLGPEHARRRFPNLSFQSTKNREAIQNLLSAFEAERP